ncbi:NAAA [Branchiostoma lanceolatum]|uniref:NAAA protein n=1 Tax=Branchiostoma lanceolatum TaxID=7740 RepID=A0A8J9ZQ14_BRALA|nr:NAAA [Branchiostoma lanceolatum]
MRAMESCRALVLSLCVLSASLVLAAGRDVPVKRYVANLTAGRDVPVKRYVASPGAGRDVPVKRYVANLTAGRDVPVKRYVANLTAGRDVPVKRYVANLAAGRDVPVKRDVVSLTAGRDVPVKRDVVNLAAGRDVPVKRYVASLGAGRDVPVKRHVASLGAGRDVPVKRYVASLGAGRDVPVKRYVANLGAGRDVPVKRYVASLGAGRDVPVKRYVASLGAGRDVPVKRYVVDLTAGRDVPVKRYVVNLDAAPEEHFLPVCQDPDIQALIPILKKDVVDLITSRVPVEVLPLLEVLTADLDRYLPQPFAGEMRGIANCTGIPLGQIVGLNLVYDLTAFCTSIVAQDDKGIIWHGRNLDYGFADFLRNITVMVDFQTKGQCPDDRPHSLLTPPPPHTHTQILYTSTSYLGYVGALTGQRPNKFTVSVDERNQGAWWMNALEALLNRKASLMSFLVRETLAEADSYDAAIQKLAYTPLIAPVYFIVGGANVAEGAVITRDRESALDIWTLNPAQGRWFVLETNYDHWTEPPAKDKRRMLAMKAMNTTGQAGINASSMFQVLSIPYVLNENTTYTAIMSAAQPQVYITWLRWPEGHS